MPKEKKKNGQPKANATEIKPEPKRLMTTQQSVELRALKDYMHTESQYCSKHFSPAIISIFRIFLNFLNEKSIQFYLFTSLDEFLSSYLSFPEEEPLNLANLRRTLTYMLTVFLYQQTHKQLYNFVDRYISPHLYWTLIARNKNIFGTSEDLTYEMADILINNAIRNANLLAKIENNTANLILPPLIETKVFLGALNDRKSSDDFFLQSSFFATEWLISLLYTRKRHQEFLSLTNDQTTRINSYLNDITNGFFPEKWKKYEIGGMTQIFYLEFEKKSLKIKNNNISPRDIIVTLLYAFKQYPGVKVLASVKTAIYISVHSMLDEKNIKDIQQIANNFLYDRKRNYAKNILQLNKTLAEVYALPAWQANLLDYNGQLQYLLELDLTGYLNSQQANELFEIFKQFYGEKISSLDNCRITICGYKLLSDKEETNLIQAVSNKLKDFNKLSIEAIDADSLADDVDDETDLENKTAISIDNQPEPRNWRKYIPTLWSSSKPTPTTNDNNELGKITWPKGDIYDPNDKQCNIRKLTGEYVGNNCFILYRGIRLQTKHLDLHNKIKNDLQFDPVTVKSPKGVGVVINTVKNKEEKFSSPFKIKGCKTNFGDVRVPIEQHDTTVNTRGEIVRLYKVKEKKVIDHYHRNLGQ